MILSALFLMLFGISTEVYFILFILGIPVFFISRRVLKKHITSDKKRKIATWIATIILTPFIYGSIIFLIVFSMSYYPSRDFDKEKWLSDEEKRYELSEDLIDSEILIGKTPKEVQQILGTPLNDIESNSWSYYLGYKPSFVSIDPDMLVIEFENGKVVRVSQHQT